MYITSGKHPHWAPWSSEVTLFWMNLMIYKYSGWLGYSASMCPSKIGITSETTTWLWWFQISSVQPLLALNLPGSWTKISQYPNKDPRIWRFQTGTDFLSPAITTLLRHWQKALKLTNDSKNKTILTGALYVTIHPANHLIIQKKYPWDEWILPKKLACPSLS